MRRVAVIFHRFGPYHWARLRAAAQYFDVLAVEQAAETAEYEWEEISAEHDPNLKRVCLLPRNARPVRPANEIARRLRKVLAQERPDTVFIPGWSDPAALAGLEWALERGVPAVLMSESTESDEQRGKLKEFIKRRIVRLCSAALVGGAPQAEYLRKLGMERDQILTGYDAVDNDYFADGARLTREEARSHREKLGLPDRYFLASSRFVPKKNLENLLLAFAAYRSAADAGNTWNLVLLGDGPLKATLLDQRSRLGLEKAVLFPGFRQYVELPSYYGLASSFVHPSLSEPWGLVVNEALAASLPVIVSRQCGCARDLVLEGENGFQFDAPSTNALTELLLRMSSKSSSELTAMGARGQEIVAGWSTGNFAKQLGRAVDASHQHPLARGGFVTRLFLRGLVLSQNAASARLLPAITVASEV